MQQEKTFIPSSWPEQQNHIFTGTRSEERTRADQEEECRQDYLDRRGEGQQVDGILTTWKGACYLLYSLDVVHPYTDQKFKLDMDKSKKIQPNKAWITITEIRWESKTSSHPFEENLEVEMSLSLIWGTHLASHHNTSTCPDSGRVNNRTSEVKHEAYEIEYLVRFSSCRQIK